MLAMTPA